MWLINDLCALHKRTMYLLWTLFLQKEDDKTHNWPTKQIVLWCTLYVFKLSDTHTFLSKNWPLYMQIRLIAKSNYSHMQLECEPFASPRFYEGVTIESNRQRLFTFIIVIVHVNKITVRSYESLLIEMKPNVSSIRRTYATHSFSFPSLSTSVSLLSSSSLGVFTGLPRSL